MNLTIISIGPWSSLVDPLPSSQVNIVVGRLKEADIIVVYLLKVDRDIMLKNLKMASHISALKSMLHYGGLCFHQWRWPKHASFSTVSSTNSTEKQA